MPDAPCPIVTDAGDAESEKFGVPPPDVRSVTAPEWTTAKSWPVMPVTLVGMFVRLPGVCWMLQVVTDASGGGPQPVVRYCERPASPSFKGSEPLNSWTRIS